jgi:hypothetical protein
LELRELTQGQELFISSGDIDDVYIDKAKQNRGENVGIHGYPT